MQAIVIEYVQQYQLEFLVVYVSTLLGSWHMIAVHRPHFSHAKDFSLAVIPLVGLLATSKFVYQDIRREMRRDVPSWL